MSVSMRALALRLAIVTPIVLMPVAVAAQGTDQTAEVDSGGDGVIIVTALPPPAAADAYGTVIIDRDRINSTSSNRLEEVLARVPGFQQFRRSDSRSANASAQGVTLRAIGGNAASRTLILLDGVPQADAFFGYVPFTALPTETIGAVRVTRGSGVGAFGAGAVAGVIDLASRAPGARPRATASLVLGNRNAIEASAGIALPLGSGFVTIDARHDQGDGFFTTPTNQRSAASVPARYRASSSAIAAEIPAGDDILLFPRIAAYRDRRTLRFAGADSSAEGVDASLRLLTRGRWQVEALGWVQARDFSTVVVSATSFRPTLDQRATPSTGWGGKVELRLPLAAGRTVRIGVDVRGGDGIGSEDVLATSGARTLSRRAGGSTMVAGGFVEGDAGIGALAITGGLRIDQWRLTDGVARETRTDGSIISDTALTARSGTIASWRSAAAWAIAPDITLRASAYSGFRLPTLNELYRGFTVFPVTTRANAALTPERLRGWEAGVTTTPIDGVTLSVTAFDNRLRDAIANVTIGTNLRQRRNIGAIRARGVEADIGVRTGPWSLDAGWAWTRARLSIDPTDSAALPLDGLRPAQTPRHSGSIGLAWQDRADGYRLQIGVRHTGAQFEDDRNSDRLPSATTVDALARLPLGRGFSLSLRGENLLDQTVITRNAGGSIDLGTPRTFWLGLRWGGD
jgi:outer membrane receptor protein involved in Fe transport